MHLFSFKNSSTKRTTDHHRHSIRLGSALLLYGLFLTSANAQVFPLSNIPGTYASDYGNAWSYSPWSISYPANSNSIILGSPGGNPGPNSEGSNASNVSFTISVAPNFYFSVYPTDVTEGVPWQNPTGVVTNGGVAGWTMSNWTNFGGQGKAVFTFAQPIYGVRFAVADIDITGEGALVQAFPVATGGSAIALTDHILSNPAAIPALASGQPNIGNNAYVDDGSKVTAGGNGLYSVNAIGNVTDPTGSVYFAYDDYQPVQRIEITYYGSNTAIGGIYVAGLSFKGTSPPAVTSVPTMSTMALMTLALFMMAAAFLALRAGPAGKKV